MIISQTPFRISFFGGGTDYPKWYHRYGGRVLSASIDKYCYITCRTLPPFFEHKYRIVYSKIEHCQNYEEIQHPAVRETLRFMDIKHGLEIHYDGDLPARSGMGTSSSFTVCLLHALYAYKGIMVDKQRLAKESIKIEQELIKEAVGAQDQVCVAYGGLNLIEFSTDGQIEVKPVILDNKRLEELESHLMLFYTGIRRTASDLAKEYANDIDRKYGILSKMQEMALEGVEILKSGRSIDEFGRLLHKAWLLKKSINSNISNHIIDGLYEKALSAGAIGGKITGAGGGGFLLLFVPPERRAEVREALADKIYVPFKFEFNGSRIIFYESEKNDFSEIEKDRANRKVSRFRELNSIKRAAVLEDAAVIQSDR